MSNSDLADVMALEPPGPGRIHLHLPGWKPSARARSQPSPPMCGVFIRHDLNKVPLEVAREWPAVRPTWAGSGDAGTRYWCPPCLGWLIEIMGHEDHVIGMALARLADRVAGDRGGPSKA